MDDLKGKLIYAALSAVITFVGGLGALCLLARKYGIKLENLKQWRKLTGAVKDERVARALHVGKLLGDLADKDIPDDRFKSIFAFVTGEPEPPKAEPPQPSEPPKRAPSQTELDAAAERYVIATAMIHGGSTTAAQVKGWQPHFSEQIILAAADRLVVKNFVQPMIDGLIKFAPALDAYPPRTAELFRHVLGGGLVVIESLGCDWYQNHITDGLLDEICRTQMDLKLTPEERAESLLLIRWSPSALLYSLTPDGMITRHKNDSPELDDKIVGFDANYFRRMLYRWLHHDFLNPLLAEYIYTRAKVTEIQRTQTYRIRHEKVLLVEGSVTSRELIGPLDPKYGGGYLHVLGYGDGDVTPDKPMELPTPNVPLIDNG